MVDRRQVLATAAGGIVALPGCLGVASGEPEVGLCSVRLFNETDEAHELILRLTEDDADVFHDTFQLDPNSLTTAEPRVTERGTYTLEATADGITAQMYLPDWATESGERYEYVAASFRVVPGEHMPYETIPLPECE